MLSLSAMSGDQASYYLGLAREDYYLEGGEPPGRWHGQGAAALKLTGTVIPDALYNLFDGLSPDGRHPLIQRQRHEERSEHRPGWDATFSAPKSVSVLWSQSAPEERAALERLHHRAVEEALDYLQDTAAVCRRGQGGQRAETGGLVVATFEHSTSRALDPQLHTHALILNVAVRADGSTGTLNSLPLFLAKMTAGALYRAELAQGLQRELGLALEREQSWFRVSGVSPELVQLFSKRREAIERVLRESGLGSAQAAAVAAIQTRGVKELVSRDTLTREWRQEGERLGWGTREARALYGAVQHRFDQAQELSAACTRAAARLTQDEAFFTAGDFVRYVAEEGQGRGLGAREVRAGAAKFLELAPEILRLGRHRGELRYTTREMLALERALLGDAQVLAKAQEQQLDPEGVVRLLSKVGAELSEEQLQAVWHLTAATGSLAVVSGWAGTGKTQMLDTARQAWEAQGYQVLGAALSVQAASELERGARICAQSITRTLHRLHQGSLRLDARTVLVVDEAGMVATPEMRRLVSHCRAAGAKLALVGDEGQNQPIGPGAPFRELGERYGRAELRDIRRQEEAWAREAVKDLVRGNTRSALDAFAKRGLLQLSETQHEAMRALVAQWRADGGRCEETLILAGTRQDVLTLNRMAQAERRSAGELGESCARLGEECFYLQDRVLFTQNRPSLGVRNGSRGTVCGVSPDGARLTVRLDHGEQVTVSPQAYPHLLLGYASTTHKAQGATTQRAYVLGSGPMQARELAYVQASRARLETRIFATRAEGGEELDQLIREMHRSRQKEMAHAVLRQRNEQAGINRTGTSAREQEKQVLRTQQQEIQRDR